MQRWDDSANPHTPARFARRLRVVTEPRRSNSNKMLRTRTLSELVFTSPRNSPRVTPRNARFDMDIEVSTSFAEGDGMVDLLSSNPMYSAAPDGPSMEQSLIVVEDSESPDEMFRSHSGQTSLLEDLDDQVFSDRMSVDDDEIDVEVEDVEDEANAIIDTPTTVTTVEDNQDEIRQGRPTGVSEVVDMLFEIHTALKSRHMGQRTAASALAASNLVSSVAYPANPMPRDEQLEVLDNTRKMLECAICQEIFTGATEALCCGQVFCKLCIERWVSERSSCPMCRDELSIAQLATSRHCQRMANEMTVPCPYCSENMKKAVLEDHMDTCADAPLEPPPPADVALRANLLAAARLTTQMMTRFLVAPSPPEALITQCYIRTRGSGNYELYTQDTDVLLCTAVRRRQLDMSVTFSIYASSAADATIARLERNFVGSQYTVFNTTEEHNTELGAVQYAATFGKTPRQMRVALPTVSRRALTSTADELNAWGVDQYTPSSRDDSMLAQIDRPDGHRAINLINKPPVWIESLEAYCLDFGGRVAAASVKNFLLSHPDDMDKTMMLFGRTSDRQVYSMDYRHPFSPVQAFAIALSSMDSHLVTFD
ncbi:hypothetical protein DYB37_006179 [Aphanomyces astaci]|uniref:RING-type domain-containing protein n=1 Tax=Aphanomyces astaci TaxID=112090 RepID=A0A397BRM6_APHAT|nr:hypothetical protein DYB25_005295 [Aphanomyces astaci]RHY24716.1 hypothetical protein DYB36_001340 [Aphanomyces astaci]RHY39254.1 hypothetical protein DYB30_002839 [Aphanomyces astaci]RHY44371.1 hypothetical protein DYB34_000430 [Aphanomyces astaci]RHY61278.1 hypothetical protein DYB38_000257 [Aphanomyces astaci]